MKVVKITGVLLTLVFLGLMAKEVAAVDQSCMWCGRDCIAKDPTRTYNCLDVMPPEGSVCVAENGQCVVKGDGVVAKNTPVPSGSPSKCIVCQGSNFEHARGNANCDGSIDKNDYMGWRNEFVAQRRGMSESTALKADFDCNGKVDIMDFAIWKVGYVMSRIRATVTQKLLPIVSGVTGKLEPTIIQKVTPKPTAIMVPKVTATATCMPRPECLDYDVPCLMAEPIGGWCPDKPTPSTQMKVAPSVIEIPKNPIPIQ